MLQTGKQVAVGAEAEPLTAEQRTWQRTRSMPSMPSSKHVPASARAGYEARRLGYGGSTGSRRGQAPTNPKQAWNATYGLDPEAQPEREPQTAQAVQAQEAM